MEQVFAVIQNSQASDVDGWDNWIHEEQISLHKSKEGAEKVINEKLKVEIQFVEEQIKDFPDRDFSNKLECIKSNTITLTDGTGMSAVEKEVPWFFVKPIDLLD